MLNHLTEKSSQLLKQYNSCFENPFWNQILYPPFLHVIKAVFSFYLSKASPVYKKYKYIGVKSCSRHKTKTWQKIFVTTGLDLRTVIIHNLKLLYRDPRYQQNITVIVTLAGLPGRWWWWLVQVVDIYHLPELTRSGDTVRRAPAPSYWRTRQL